MTEREAWVSVDDRLPANGQAVLALEDGLCVIASVEGTYWIQECDGMRYSVSPTHWQPLPRPPRSND